MRNTVIAVAVMAAVVGTLAAPIAEDYVVAEEDTIFVQTDAVATGSAATEEDKKEPEVNKVTKYHYVEKGGYPNFDKAQAGSPTGSFSRRRVMLGDHSETSKQFDDMFSKYYQNPTLDIDAEEEQGAGEDKDAGQVKATATVNPPVKRKVEVINELKPIHTMPKPNVKDPPQEFTYGGKDYEVSKVINVVKSMPARAPVPPPPVPLKPTATPPPIKAEADDDKDDDSCTTCVTAFKAQGGCNLWKSGSDPSSAIPPECAHCAFAAASACHLKPHNKIVAKASPPSKEDAKIAKAKEKGTKKAEKKLQQEQKKKKKKEKENQGVTIDKPNRVGGTSIGEPITLPPINMGHEPVSERQQRFPLHRTPSKPPVPVEAPKPVPDTPPPLKDVEPEDQVFGYNKAPKQGVWAGGNSDYSIAAPWDTNSDSPFGAKGGGNTAPAVDPTAKFAPAPAEVMVEEILAVEVPKPAGGPVPAATADAKAPWDASAEKAPWEVEQDHKHLKASLLQMAARSCAARKQAQHSSCSKVTAKATKDCSATGTACDSARRSAQEHCKRTEKETLKACFNDWKQAKQAM